MNRYSNELIMDYRSSKRPILSCEEDEEGAEELLEDSWYFGNLIHAAKSASPRSSYQETYESIKRQSQKKQSGPSTCLMKTPSMPPILEASSSGSDVGRRRRSEAEAEAEMASSDHLHEEVHDEEVEFSMGTLIRQASLKKSDVMLPANHTPKGVTTISARKQEFGKLKLERLRPRREMSRLKPQKSLSDLQSQELRSLGLQELKIKEEEEVQDEVVEGRKSSREDDMKAQIKFWARAVASNVR